MGVSRGTSRAGTRANREGAGYKLRREALRNAARAARSPLAIAPDTVAASPRQSVASPAKNSVCASGKASRRRAELPPTLT